MPDVHVTMPLPERVMAELAADFVLVGEAGGVEGLVATPRDPVDAALLDAVGPQLRVVALFAVGYDNVDLAAATERRVVVTNTPDVLTAATAELTVALVLSLLRRVAEGDRHIRRREPWGFAPTFMVGNGLAGKTLGIVGFGRIGREVGTAGRGVRHARDPHVALRRPRARGAARRGRRRQRPHPAQARDAASDRRRTSSAG